VSCAIGLEIHLTGSAFSIVSSPPKVVSCVEAWKTRCNAEVQLKLPKHLRFVTEEWQKNHMIVPLSTVVSY